MASPLRNLKKTSSQLYVTAFNSNKTNKLNSPIRLLNVHKQLKTFPPQLTDKSLNSLDKKTVKFITSPSKIDEEDLNQLLYRGLPKEDKYKILGKGGFGTVVQLETKDVDIAVKVVINSKESASLMKEQNAIGLKHPNLIEVFDVITREDAPFGLVLMESWFSINLHTLIHKSYKTITCEERLSYVLNTSCGLEYCHSAGVVHLDVKPLNILVDVATNNCKLCDFGGSCNLFKRELGKSQKRIHQGTIQYAAPELLKGEEPTVKCDTYSLGITMWQILHGDLPYKGVDKDILIYKVVSLGVRPPCFIFTEPSYSHLYTQCWSTFPGNRPTISKVREELQSMLSQLSNRKSMPIFQLL